MFEHREGHPAHHPVLGQPLVCRMAKVVSLYRSQTASVFDGGYKNIEMRLQSQLRFYHVRRSRRIHTSL